MINEIVSKASKNLLFSEPFYGLFLIGLNKVYRKDIPTACVSKSGISVQLAINPDFASSLSQNHLIGLLKHELLHVAFGHLSIFTEFDDRKLFNIAADLEINQYIDDGYLPEGGITLDTFPELKLPVKAGTVYYYKLLQQAKNDNTSPSLNNLLNQMDGSTPYDHSLWKEFEDSSDAEKKLIKSQIEHQMKEVAESIQKARGTIPGELFDIIKRINTVEPPKFDWKGYLRRFVGNSTIIYTKKLKRKYNKRYVENPGLKIKRKNHVLVAIDTSGSVSRNELVEFMQEIYHIHKTGHKITVAQCDTEIKSIEDFNPKKDIDILGRGGTDFQPVIDHFNQNKYTALIYLTDGECNAPDNCPKNTLWVLSSRSKLIDHLPGKTIKLN